MSLQDSLAGPRELIVAAVMEEVCVAERMTGRALDPDTGVLTEVWEPLYAGPCKASPAPLTTGRGVAFGEAEVVLHRYLVALPFSAAEPIGPNDRIRVTETADPWLRDRPLHVIDVVYSATAVTRKLYAEDKSG